VKDILEIEHLQKKIDKLSEEVKPSELKNIDK